MLAGLKDIDVHDAHQTVVIGSADPDTAAYLHIGLGAPIAECRCLVIDGKGIAIYVADIIYRSDAIKLHIDLLANARGGRASRQPANTRTGGEAEAPRPACSAVAIDLVLRLG